jgi:hypothetical protein
LNKLDKLAELCLLNSGLPVPAILRQYFTFIQMSLDKNIIKSIQKFRKSIAAQLPALENEVNSIVTRKEKDSKTIEHLLDTLLSLSTAGVAEDLFIRLLNYYKTIDAGAAADYWRFFEEINE